MGKKEREAIALKKRQEEVAAKKSATDEERLVRQKYLDQASMSSGRQGQSGHRRWAEREEEREKHREEGVTLKDKEKEMDAIKVCLCVCSLFLLNSLFFSLSVNVCVCVCICQSRYLGAVKKRRKMRRLADRKFVFDWDTGEDTSTDFNPMLA